MEKTMEKTMEKSKGAPRAHIAFLPTPGMGHLIPITELAKLLADRHNFTSTIITFSDYTNKSQETLISSLPSSISSLPLPPIPLSDLPPDARIETRISVAAARSVPFLRTLLLDLISSTPLVAFVADLFASPACEALKDLDFPHFIFIPSNLQFLTLMLHLPDLHNASPLDFHQRESPIRLPGFPPIPGTEILHPLQDRKNECYKWMLEHSKRYRNADGILVNTFDAIEPEAAKLLKKGEINLPENADSTLANTIEPKAANLLKNGEGNWPPVFTVGPLIRFRPNSGESAAECLKFLDLQPTDSVLFVSFGSAGVLSTEQMGELALGLEASGHRFLWVVRSPSDHNSSAYFTAKSRDDPFACLPAGFVERTKGVGFVVPSWAPQVEVLAHAATGGFLSHCGWNSALESAAHGVPMIAWPLFAEQKMNAVMLVEGTGVAMRLTARKDGVFDRMEIAGVVRELMAGEGGKAVRRRAKELEIAASAAMGVGGSSSAALAEVAARWRSSAAV